MTKRRRTDHKKTKKRRTRQCNDPSSFGHSIVLAFFFWSLHCLILLLLVIALSCPSSFGHCIVLSFLFPKEEGQDNRMTKRKKKRQ
jgi:hypothetical protein